MGYATEPVRSALSAMAPNPYRLGQRIKEIRQARDLTRLELADRIGASPVHIAQIERGERVLSDVGLRRIAQVLDVNVVDLRQPFGSGLSSPLRQDQQRKASPSRG